MGSDSKTENSQKKEKKTTPATLAPFAKARTVAKCVLLSAIFILISHRIFKATGTVVSKVLLSSAWTGFLAGCLHTLSGPDHLAALAPLSIGRTRLESAAVGALWGCGHDAGHVIFGLLFLLLKDQLHLEILTSWGARVIGLTLLVIGVMGIKEASEVGVGPTQALEDVSSPRPKKKIGFATFATGIVHGLQPDALMMVLPALALPSRVAGAAFLVMYLIGTVVSMGSYTVFIGSCSQALKDRVPRITEKLTWASSIVVIALGSSILVSQFFGIDLY
ncbi:Chloroplast protein FOR GROWTH AND FERTILITY 2 [Linum grandiflorum]